MLLSYILKRVAMLIPILIAISIVIFFVIQLPPGDYLTTYIVQQRNSGREVDESSIINMTRRYGLDQPVPLQYLFWIRNIVTRLDFGHSMQWNQPVAQILSERLPATISIALLTLIITWGASIPIGIYSATHQYSAGDYIFIFIGFIGLAVPRFLLALGAVYFIFVNTGQSLTGLFSADYVNAPWSIAKIIDMLPRLGLVVFIIGLSQTAGLIRQMRAMLLDELEKQYVITARAKGLEEKRLLWKYPIRMAVNPMISTIGWILPGLISGELVVSIVLSMPTMGPIVRRALISQDMYLAGSFLLIVSVLTVVGTLISDILLAIVDPRIRFGGVAE